MELQFGTEAKQEALPAIRGDLELLDGPRTGSGAPTWTIYDTLAGRYFRIGWLEFEILTHWRAGHPPSAVLQALRARPLLQVDEKDIASVVEFLRLNALVAIEGEKDTQGLLAQSRSQQKGPIGWILKNYLYLKIPLVRPDEWLSWLNRKSGFIFSTGFIWFSLLSILLSVWLVSQEWVRWFSDLSLVKTPQGMALAAAMVLFAKVVHEIGHGLAAKNYGCRVPRMGVALILLWPVLWTDTTHAWRLTDRRKRLVIDSAGVIAELVLASIATILWALAPEGAVKSALHILSGVTWIMTLVVNANPFMRFDGYYILADAVDIPNLQERAFSHAKWWLRRHLLGLEYAPPEQWPVATGRFLLVYAIACWIYRLILFTGIALIVYAYFFKLLGLILFAVEIWFFILRPVVTEIRAWKKGIKTAKHFSSAARITTMILALIIAMAALPIHRVITLPGYVRASQEYVLEAPSAAKVVSLNISNGQVVKKDDVLAVLDAPDLSMQEALAHAQTDVLRRQYKGQAYVVQKYDRAIRLRQQAAVKAAEARAYAAGMARLHVVAQAEGVIRDVPPDLRVGDWLGAKEPFGLLIGHDVQITVYADESVLHRIAAGQSARVLASGTSHADGVELVVTRVDIRPVDTLPYPELSAEHGGPIALRPGSRQDGRQNSAPAQRIFEISLSPASPDGKVDIHQSAPVQVLLTAKAHSPLLSFLRSGLNVLIRESGF